MKLNLYCEVVGGRADVPKHGKVPIWTGPRVRAKNLFNALLKYSDLDFCFYVYAPGEIAHERVKPYSGPKAGDVNHVLNTKPAVLECARAFPDVALISGPNVLFDYYPLDDDMRSRYSPEHYPAFELERAICAADVDLYLFPVRPEQKYDERLTGILRGKPTAAFPTGFDTERFLPVYNEEKPIDVLILAKAPYSSKGLYDTTIDMARRLEQSLKDHCRVVCRDSYHYEEYPALLRSTKIMIHATSSEMQALSIMEAFTAGVPVIHGVYRYPYQPPGLEPCHVEYRLDAFLDAVPWTLQHYRELGYLARRYIEENHSLEKMVRRYEKMLEDVIERRRRR